MKKGYVYMMSNKPRGTIYIGATEDYWRRTQEHKTKMFDGFSRRYGVNRLVWIEEHETVEDAFAMEKKLNNLLCEKKIEIIERNNPDWRDLYNELTVYNASNVERSCAAGGWPPHRIGGETQ